MLSRLFYAIVQTMTRTTSSEPAAPPATDRRARRRQQTIDEILDIAVAIMSEEGVNG